MHQGKLLDASAEQQLSSRATYERGAGSVQHLHVLCVVQAGMTYEVHTTEPHCCRALAQTRDCS